MTTPRLLLPFCDDSTLIFALRMRDVLLENAPMSRITLGYYLPEQALSPRQFERLLPDGDFITIDKGSLLQVAENGQYDAILTSRVYRPLANALKTPAFKNRRHRAQVISFLGGLDFFPERGYANRIPCDGVFLFPRSEIKTFTEYAATQAATNSHLSVPLVGFGHPTFLEPSGKAPANLNDRKDIYYFAQAISPLTRRGRQHVLEAMVALAEANPDRTVWIKLRHLPDENTRHLHREKHDYPTLLQTCFPDAPGNLRFTACTMDDALKDAAIGITCTSTAAIDLIRDGLPTMVYLDYVDNYMDPLAPAMRRIFKDSGLITTLEDLLHLRTQPPEPAWVEQLFCPRDLGEKVIAMVDELQSGRVTSG